MTKSALFLPPLAIGVAAAPWIKSVALAVALGGAVSVGLAASPRVLDRSDDASGAETFIELAALTESASSVSSEAAQSDAEDTPPTPEVDEAQAKKVENELPTEQASPVPPEEDELRMAQERTQRLSETANEEDQATEAMKAQTAVASSRASAASENSDGKPDAAVATAPEHGNSADGRRRIEQWQRRLFGHIARHKIYPEAARKSRASGEAVLAFHVTRSGAVSDVRVLKSSGYAVLDGAALDVMRRANPVPALPRELKGETFEFSLPMRFSLK